MSAVVLGTRQAVSCGMPFTDSASTADGRAGIDIVIPFHRNENLVAHLMDSLVACADELRDVGAGIVAINDSPDHEPLRLALESARQRLGGADIPLAVVTNASNIGFVRSANIGLAHAREAGHDALLLNSDTQVFPGAIAEMLRVAALDPMIGFVSPRSNNATIASLPPQEAGRDRSPSAAYEAFRWLSAQLPECHYVPTAVGFCLLVKHSMLAGFGLLDPAYGAGYSEENDLIMRANRHGYRAVLANRAFVHHRGNTSFGPRARRELEGRNARLLAERYPEYPRAVRAFVAGPVHQAERVLAGGLPDGSGRRDVLFDLSDIDADGAAGAAKALLRELSARHASDFNLFVMGDAGCSVVRDIAASAAVQLLPLDTDRTFAVGLRFSQPLTRESFLRLNRLAVRTAWFMHDTNPWDCLSRTSPELDWVWRQVFEHGDCILHASERTRGQFAARFPSADATRHLVAPPGGHPGRAVDSIGAAGSSLDPALAAPRGRWADAADEIAGMLRELQDRPDAFVRLLRRLASVGPAPSGPAGHGAASRDATAPLSGPVGPPGLRRLAERVRTAPIVSPLRSIWDRLRRGGVRASRDGQ